MFVKGQTPPNLIPTHLKKTNISTISNHSHNPNYNTLFKCKFKFYRNNKY